MLSGGGDAAAGPGLLLPLAAVGVFLVGGLLVWLLWRRVYAGVARQERQCEWYATVIAKDVQWVRVGGVPGGGGAGHEDSMVTVHYRRDDGLQGQMAAYGTGYERHAVPAAYRNEAPTFEMLGSLEEGDRLFKPYGRLYPQKAT